MIVPPLYASEESTPLVPFADVVEDPLPPPPITTGYGATATGTELSKLPPPPV